MPTSRWWPVVVIALALLGSCSRGAVARSSDGGFQPEIAYLRLTEGHWQVWVTDREGQLHRQLTRSPVDKVRVSWLPNHGYLLCNRNDGVLERIDMATGEEKLLDTPVTGMLDAQLSPDGKWVVFTLAPPQSPDTNDIWIMSVEGREARKLTNQAGGAKTPSWHPDGSSIVYTINTRRDSQQLWRVSFDGKSLMQLTSGEDNKFDPSYNRAGDLVYSGNAAGNYDLWLVPKEGDGPRRITRDPALDAQPSWSPDGRSLAFYSLRGGKRRIWVWGRDSGLIRPLTPPEVQSRYPAWAP